MTIEPLPLTHADILSRAETFVDDYARISGGKERLLIYGIQFDKVYEELIYPTFGIELDESADLGFDDTGQKIWFFRH